MLQASRHDQAVRTPRLRRFLVWPPAVSRQRPAGSPALIPRESELPNEVPTLTTDLEDYPPFSYVYFTGTGFEPGETVNMIVVELSPNPASFEP